MESDLDLNIPQYSPPCFDPPPERDITLKNKTIAIARDSAFSFIYPANLALLESLGARLVFFSPLNNESIPNSDALWLPGGYPELHAETLARNTVFLESIKHYVRSGKPGLAECGGMMVLGQTICTIDNCKHAMAKAFPAAFLMKPRFQSVGYQSLFQNGREIRGHSFHHSVITTDQLPFTHWKKRNGEQGEAVFQVGGLVASYGHSYFASSAEWVEQVFTQSGK